MRMRRNAHAAAILLEVVGPAKQVSAGGKAVLQIPLRISCSLNTPTIEKSRASRQRQQLGRAANQEYAG